MEYIFKYPRLCPFHADHLRELLIGMNVSFRGDLVFLILPKQAYLIEDPKQCSWCIPGMAP